MKYRKQRLKRVRELACAAYDKEQPLRAIKAIRILIRWETDERELQHDKDMLKVIRYRRRLERGY